MGVTVRLASFSFVAAHGMGGNGDIGIERKAGSDLIRRIAS
jgi:hypothetical protein